jgi:ribosome maturation factor RimP
MNEQVQKYADEILSNYEDVFLVALNFLNEDKSLIVELLVDTDEGITLNVCAKISRELSDLLEENEVIESAYNVIVSSPGLTRSMSHPRQFKKSVGKDLSIVFAEENMQQNNGDFAFEAYNDADDVLTLKAKNKEIKVTREQIKSATIKLKW